MSQGISLLSNIIGFMFLLLVLIIVFSPIWVTIVLVVVSRNHENKQKTFKYHIPSYSNHRKKANTSVQNNTKRHSSGRPSVIYDYADEENFDDSDSFSFINDNDQYDLDNENEDNYQYENYAQEAYDREEREKAEEMEQLIVNRLKDTWDEDHGNGWA